MIRRPPRSPLFPYTPLSRSSTALLAGRANIPRQSGTSPRRARPTAAQAVRRSEEHTSELQSPCNLVCRLLLEKKKKNKYSRFTTNDQCSQLDSHWNEYSCWVRR